MVEVILPSLGQTTSELTLLHWFKHDGDAVREGDTLAEIQTDKAIVELPATADGILRGVRVQNGDVVEAGTLLAEILTEEESNITRQASPVAAVPPIPSAIPNSSPVHAEPSQLTTLRARRISPLARAIAKKEGIDLAQLAPTRADGVIKRLDVMRWMQERPSTAIRAEGQRQPLSRMRQVIAARLVASKQAIPHYYVSVHADVTELVRFREELKSEGLSLNSFFVRAVARALRAFPKMNVSYDGDAVIVHADIHIGIAVEVEDGLLVPVVRTADRKNIRELSSSLDDLIARARQGRLPPQELSDGRFTISNLGMFGVDEFSAIINPPESAILAVGRIRREWVVRGPEPVIGEMLTLTLSADHRIIDGALAGRFLHAVADDLEHPSRLLLPLA